MGRIQDRSGASSSVVVKSIHCSTSACPQPRRASQQRRLHAWRRAVLHSLNVPTSCAQPNEPTCTTQTRQPQAARAAPRTDSYSDARAQCRPGAAGWLPAEAGKTGEPGAAAGEKRAAAAHARALGAARLLILRRPEQPLVGQPRDVARDRVALPHAAGRRLQRRHLRRERTRITSESHWPPAHLAARQPMRPCASTAQQGGL